VGGTVTGLTGSVTLQNNVGDDIIKTTNDGFTFTAQAEGSDYAVTVSSQPTGQTCTVTNGSGTNITANITNVTVTCVTDVVPTYTVGGTVSGLIGSVTLYEDTSGEDLALSTNGSFAFATEQVDGTPYAVTVLAQPTGQTCSVTNGSGTITTADVTNVSVACIDDVVAPPPVPMVPIPTLSEWALILLTMLLGLMVFANRRRLF
jgi:predicted transcriptional regulator